MSNLEMKNIVDVDVIETASGEENLLVESNGLLKRLPSSNFSGGGSSGGSGGGTGAGFDLICRKATVYSIEGRDTVRLADNVIPMPEQGAEFEISFDVFFPVADAPDGGYDPNNLYKRNSFLAGTTYEVFGYYDDDNSEWAFAIPSVGEVGDNFDSIFTITDTI